MTIDHSTICPHCGEEHERVTSAVRDGRDRPRDGDATICWECGALGIYEDRAPGGIRKPTKHEQRALDRDERVQQILAAWRDGWVERQ